MNERIVLCDVDEVCADLLTEWVRRYNIRWNDNLDPNDITGWDLTEFVRPECGRKVYDILRDPDIYDHVQPVEGALEGVLSLRAMGYRVVFVSSCVAGSTDAKVEWLFTHRFLPRQKTPRDFIAAKDKALVRGAVLIDDALHNIIAFPGFGILFDKAHNRYDARACGLIRAENWKNIPELVDALLSR